MSLPPCKIIQGHAFNVQENEKSPLKVLNANLDMINELVTRALNDERICFVGSSCMYPVRDTALREEWLGTGEVYPGNALYAYLKLLGWQICQAASKERKTQCFMVIPSDIFGEVESSHFVMQLMKKMHWAKEAQSNKVSLWGTGTSVRHPLFKDDFDRILLQLCESYEGTDAINIAPPVSFAKSVGSIALDIREVVGFKGDIEWDASFSDGQKVKILDNTRLTRLGFGSFTPWREALEKTYYEIKSHL